MELGPRQSLATTDTIGNRVTNPYLSIVIPVYNEEENLVALQSRLVESLGKMELSYEIIYIDDGSCDSSFAILQRLALEDKRIKVVKFRKNYGQTAAMSAGIDLSQ